MNYPKPMALSLPPTIMEQAEEVSTPLGSVQCWRHHLRRRDRIRAQLSTLLNGDPMKLHEAIGLELERREMEITFEFACRDDCLGKMVPSDLRQVVAERDRLKRSATRRWRRLRGMWWKGTKDIHARP